MDLDQHLHVADTVPYPWPYDGRLEGQRLALVICGAQRQLLAPGSAGPDPALVARFDALAGAVRAGGGQVVWVRHGRRALPSRLTGSLPVRGTEGWALTTEPTPTDVVLDSAGWDGCFGSDLEHTLRSAGTDLVLLGGWASEITVDSTVRTLNDRGFECLVLTDACAPVDAHLGARAHHSLTMSGGIFGALGTSAAVHAALCSASSSPSSSPSSTTSSTTSSTPFDPGAPR